MITARELVMPIEQLAPISMQEGWDNCGFSVGDSNKEVKRALVALDCSEDVINEAITLKCDIVITHHPLIFGNIKNITPCNFTGRIIEKAIKNNIVIYSAHTNMDKAIGGVSGLMADKLELIERMPLTEEGFGIVGNLKTPIVVLDFVKLVKERFALSNISTSKLFEQEITRIAVCGGSGGSYIKDAMQRGAQVYITGDITYHNFYCERGFTVIDIGHYGSEYGVVKLFSNIICKNFPTFTVLISTKNNNPIYYH
ncbi:MAG: Nif3-like dinuclear metal center hexameric protein [Bacteroidales bacterium]